MGKRTLFTELLKYGTFAARKTGSLSLKSLARQGGTSAAGQGYFSSLQNITLGQTFTAGLVALGVISGLDDIRDIYKAMSDESKILSIAESQKEEWAKIKASQPIEYAHFQKDNPGVMERFEEALAAFKAADTPEARQQELRSKMPGAGGAMGYMLLNASKGELNKIGAYQSARFELKKALGNGIEFHETYRQLQDGRVIEAAKEIRDDFNAVKETQPEVYAELVKTNPGVVEKFTAAHTAFETIAAKDKSNNSQAYLNARSDLLKAVRAIPGHEEYIRQLGEPAAPNPAAPASAPEVAAGADKAKSDPEKSRTASVSPAL